jgi:hypothetical protein
VNPYRDGTICSYDLIGSLTLSRSWIIVVLGCLRRSCTRTSARRSFLSRSGLELFRFVKLAAPSQARRAAVHYGQEGVSNILGLLSQVYPDLLGVSYWLGVASCGRGPSEVCLLIERRVVLRTRLSRHSREGGALLKPTADVAGPVLGSIPRSAGGLPGECDPQ